MALKEYVRKRAFDKTPEPSGKSRIKKRKETASIFVVQLHHASHRHYDFRLEVNGVLKSWAVPKGPSLDPSVKRMAVEVEDHPLDYANFEGDIPKGQYGGGHVALFDTGTWTSVGTSPSTALKKGHLKFTLEGERLKGEWHLVRTGLQRAKAQWLLFKSDDEFAAPLEADDLLSSAASACRDGAELLSGFVKDRFGATDRNAKSLEPPVPMLARLVDVPPAGSDWLHEIKWDGYRVLAVIKNGVATLWSRNGIDWTSRMPSVASSVASLNINDGVLDGEVIVGKGTRDDFNALQSALKAQQYDALTYIAFDLLSLDDIDLRNLPLIQRKSLLKATLECAPGHVGYSHEARSPVSKALKVAVDAGYEGIVSKRANSPYIAGRSDAWLKTKSISSQEFAVVGYTPPKGQRQGIGALLLATPEGSNGWRYVGRVGTGIAHDDRLAFAKGVDGKGSQTPTVSVGENDNDLSKAKWIPPAAVVEVFVRGYTDRGLLRQASFKAFRSDKQAADLREVATRIALSSPEKILFPNGGITKQDVWAYYNAVMPWLLRELENRPLSLLRCPGGIDDACFFQKHVTKDMNDLGLNSPARTGPDSNAVVVMSPEDVRLLIQYNTIEFHAWGALATNPERADLLVFDLDPDISVRWRDVIEAARDVRTHLQKTGLESFVRTTGGKGLHVVVPLNPPAPWAQAKAFAEAFAKTLATLKPELYVASASKEKRRKKIFIDWLRNGRGATSVASFSLRARQNAPVALPLLWSDLGKVKSGDIFTLRNVPKRVAKWKEHPWHNFHQLKQTLPHTS